MLVDFIDTKVLGVFENVKLVANRKGALAMSFCFLAFFGCNLYATGGLAGPVLILLGKPSAFKRGSQKPVTIAHSATGSV